MKRDRSILFRITKTQVLSVFAATLILTPQITLATDSQFSEKSIALLQSCDENQVSGFATLKERVSSEGIKEIDVYMRVEGLTDGKHAIHIHETASCQPCGNAGGHFDPGNFGMTNPDANHPFHSGDLINIDSDNGLGVMTTNTSRITLSDGPLSLSDADGSAFIVHDNVDSYCPEGQVAGCAGGSRAACGIITSVNLTDNFELMVSVSSSRSNSVELASAELTNRAYIFLDPVFPAASIQSVTFYLNGDEFVRTENFQPYDLAGTQGNNLSGPFDTRSIADGTHNLAAVIQLLSGEQTFVSSEFTVDNDSTSFGNGTVNPNPQDPDDNDDDD